MAVSAETHSPTLSLGHGPVRPRAWLARHLQGLLSALGRMTRAPLASFMTCAVIGVALALPAALFVSLDNLAQVAVRWEGGAQVSLFMREDQPAEAVRQLASTLTLRPDIVAVQTISPAEALAEYRALAGNEVALQALDGQNPLPWLLVLKLEDAYAHADAVAGLVTELQVQPGVELVEYDQLWLRRMAAIMRLAQRIALVLAVGLALGVLLVIGNTVRLEIERRRDEIQVLRLVGGTDAFIRRPFLYAGLWYGLFGAVLAALLVAAGLVAIDTPLQALVDSYAASFALRWPGPMEVLALLAAGGLLGLTGAWLSVGRYLMAAEDAGERGL